MHKGSVFLIFLVFSTAILFLGLLPVDAYATSAHSQQPSPTMSNIAASGDNASKPPAWYSYVLTSTGWINTACVAVITFLADRKNKLIKGLPQSLLSREFPPFQKYVEKCTKKFRFMKRPFTWVTAVLSNNDILRACSFGFCILIAVWATLDIPFLVVVTWIFSTIFTFCILTVQYSNNKNSNTDKVKEYLKKCLDQDLSELRTTGTVVSQRWQSALVCMCNNSTKENKYMEPDSHSNYPFIMECLFVGLKQTLGQKITFPPQGHYYDEGSAPNSRFVFICKAINIVLTNILPKRFDFNNKASINALNDIMACLDNTYKDNLNEAVVLFLYIIEFFVLHFFVENNMKFQVQFVLNSFAPPAYSGDDRQNNPEDKMKYDFFLWLVAYVCRRMKIEPSARCTMVCDGIGAMHDKVIGIDLGKSGADAGSPELLRYFNKTDFDGNTQHTNYRALLRNLYLFGNS